MNLLLLRSEELGDVPACGDATVAAELHVRIEGRRADHVRRIHRAAVGDSLRVGVLGGRLGLGRVLALCGDRLELAVRLDREPPGPLPVTLVLALPRPLVLKRVLLHATSLGVKRIALIHARRVEKSYWQSDALAAESLEEQLLLGLEQAGDTVLPAVSLHRRFRPFVEDVLPALLAGSRGLVAHPGARRECARGDGPVTLAIGPEGGFIEHEVEKLEAAGLAPVRLGERILRVEAAVPYAIARLI